MGEYEVLRDETHCGGGAEVPGEIIQRDSRMIPGGKETLYGT